MTILLSMVMMALAVACTSEKEKKASSETVQPSAYAVASTAVPATTDCFDLKMEKWYEAFNRYQDQGYDMKTADQKAVQDSEKEYKSCQQWLNENIAKTDADALDGGEEKTVKE